MVCFQQELFSEVLSKKYLTELSWSEVNSKKLAVASSDSNIFILQDNGDGFKKIGELAGHQSSVTFVSWSTQSENKLVSTSFDHTVRVWDTNTMECIAWSAYENKMHCAIFLPTGNCSYLYIHLKNDLTNKVMQNICNKIGLQMKISLYVLEYPKLCTFLKFRSVL